MIRSFSLLIAEGGWGSERKPDEMSIDETTPSKKPIGSHTLTGAQPIGPNAPHAPLPTRIAFIGNYLPRRTV